MTCVNIMPVQNTAQGKEEMQNKANLVPPLII